MSVNTELKYKFYDNKIRGLTLTQKSQIVYN